MAEAKYVIATIKLPIEMLADGTFKTHADRADIGFLPCGSLPPINTELNSSAFDKLQELLGQTPSTEFSRSTTMLRSNISGSLQTTNEKIEISDSPMFVFKKIDLERDVDAVIASQGERINSVDTAPICDTTEPEPEQEPEPEPEPAQNTNKSAIINEVLNSFDNAMTHVYGVQSLTYDGASHRVRLAPNLFIKKEELQNKTPKRSLSTTFKTRPKQVHHFSSKKRE
jgi:hypothetical protein